MSKPSHKNIKFYKRLQGRILNKKPGINKFPYDELKVYKRYIKTFL